MFAVFRKVVRFKRLDEFDQCRTRKKGRRWSSVYQDKEYGNIAAEIEYDAGSGCVETIQVSEENRDRSLEVQMVGRAVQHMQEEEQPSACVWLNTGVHLPDAHLYGIGTSGKVGPKTSDSWPIDATAKTMEKVINRFETRSLDSWYTDPESLPPWV